MTFKVLYFPFLFCFAFLISFIFNIKTIIDFLDDDMFPLPFCFINIVDFDFLKQVIILLYPLFCSNTIMLLCHNFYIFI